MIKRKIRTIHGMALIAKMLYTDRLVTLFSRGYSRPEYL